MSFFLLIHFLPPSYIQHVHSYFYNSLLRTHENKSTFSFAIWYFTPCVNDLTGTILFPLCVKMISLVSITLLSALCCLCFHVCLYLLNFPVILAPPILRLPHGKPPTTILVGLLEFLQYSIAKKYKSLLPIFSRAVNFPY